MEQERPKAKTKKSSNTKKSAKQVDVSVGELVEKVESLEVHDDGATTSHEIDDQEHLVENGIVDEEESEVGEGEIQAETSIDICDNEEDKIEEARTFEGSKETPKLEETRTFEDCKETAEVVDGKPEATETVVYPTIEETTTDGVIIAEENFEPEVSEILESKTIPCEPAMEIPKEEAISEAQIAGPESVTPSAPQVHLYPSLPAEPVEHPKINYEFESQMEEASIEPPSLDGEKPLTEEQLRTFYSNPVLDALDDDVEDFIKQNLSLNVDDDFYRLVSDYLESLRVLRVREKAFVEIEEEVNSLLANVWSFQNQSVSMQGKCGDNKPASGETTIRVAVLSRTNLRQLSDKLVSARECTMNKKAVALHQCCSLKLQCQSIVSATALQYMQENRVSVMSPTCVSYPPETGCRKKLFHCLDVLFHFLRKPALPERFTNNVEGWISVLASSLVKAMTECDQFYLLNQLLRCPIALESWGASAFIQPVPDGLNRDKAVDNFVALLACLISPVRGREEFLEAIINHELGDDSWTLLDDSGDEEENRLVAVTESDLLAILHQFNFDRLFAKFLDGISGNDITNSLCLRVFAFELTFVKVVADGMHTYDRDTYRQICRQLAYVMRQSVQYVAEFWDACKDCTSLNRAQLQMELDRLLLVVMYCLIASRRLGVWQFLVDLPYASGSALCHWRALYLLTATDLPRLHEMIAVESDTVLQSFNAGETLATRAAALESSDVTYLLMAAAKIACKSSDNRLAQCVVGQILQASFIDENMRPNQWKVGQECVGSILAQHKTLFSFIIRFIDRNLSVLGSYCDEMLSSVALADLTVTVDDLSILGKWLVANSPDTSPNKLAQQVLSKLNWGPAVDGTDKTVLPAAVHLAAAEALVSAHHAHCSTCNSLIAVSWKRASKLASRIPDAETKFDSFCWFIVLKLKIPSDVNSPLINNSKNLLANFLTASKLISTPSANTFGDLSVLENLLNANCFVGFIALLTSYVFHSPSSREESNYANLCTLVDRLVNAESSYYFSYLFGSTSPSTNSQILASSITNSILCAEGLAPSVSCAWVSLLTQCKCNWNTDANILFVLERIVQCSFMADETLTMLKAELKGAHQRLVEVGASRGVLGWFSSYPPVVPLLTSDKYYAYPFLSYCCLLVEQDLQMYQFVTAALLKNSANTVDQALKSASTKSHLSLTCKDLLVCKWVEYICNVEYDSGLVAVACQQLMLQLMARHKQGEAKCLGLRYLRASPLKGTWDVFVKSLDSKIEKCAQSTEQMLQSRAELLVAVKSWLSDVRLYTPDGTHLAGVKLDFLVHLLISGDSALWMHYVDIDKCRKQCYDLGLVYANLRCLVPLTQVLNSAGSGSPRVEQSSALQRLCSRLQLNSDTNQSKPVPTPSVPPPIAAPDADTLKQARKLIAFILPSLQALANAASKFCAVSGSLTIADLRIIEVLPALYTRVQTQTSIALKCSSNFAKCNNPNTVKIEVDEWNISASVKSQLEGLKSCRRDELRKLEGSPWVDEIPAHTALVNQVLMALIEQFRASVEGSADFICLHDSGICLLAQLISSFHQSLLSCPITKSAYSMCLDTLAGVFINGQSSQQCQLLDWLIDRDDLVQFLAPHFSPSVLTGHLFVQVYEKLADLFVKFSFSREALLQLFSKLEMDGSLKKCSAEEVVLLMQMINTCLLNQRCRQKSLHTVLSSHWVSCSVHNFPNSFTMSLNIMLEGCANLKFPSDVLDAVVASVVTLQPLSPANADTICGLLSSSLSVARQNYSLGLLNACNDYLASLSLLAAHCLKQASAFPFDSDDLNIIEDGIRLWFERVCHVFAPLVEPVAQVCPPWTPDSNDTAAVIIENFIDVLLAIHAKTERMVPWGCQNVTSLFWQFYCAKLSCMKRACAHVISAWQAPALKLPWKTFYPSLMAMDGFRQVFEVGASECQPLVTCIFVRIDWKALCEYSYKHQPTDAQTLFMHLLLYSALKCAATPANYEDCKVSFPRTLEQLCSLSWVWLDFGRLEATLIHMADTFDTKLVIDHENQIHQIVLNLVCAASEFESSCVESVEETVNLSDRALKQSAYVQFYLAVLRRAVMDRSASMEKAHELLHRSMDNTNHVLMELDKLRANNCIVASKYISFIATQVDSKSINYLVTSLVSWIMDHPDSLLVRLFLSTAANPSMPITSAFNIVEHCLQAHFLKNDGAPCWEDLIGWVQIPTDWQKGLRKENNGQLYLLTLHATLTANIGFVGRQTERLQFEVDVIKDLLKLFAAIKTKPVSEEANVVLLLGHCVRLIIRQFEFGCAWTVVGGLLQELTALCLSSADDKQGFLGAIGINRKKVFSTKLKLVCLILGAYLTQQTLADLEGVRLAENTAVLQSRIQFVKDMKNNKYLSQYSACIDSALEFFTNPSKYNLNHAPQVLALVSKQVFIEKYMSALPI